METQEKAVLQLVVCYGVKAAVLCNEAVVSTAYTSYDIADHWNRAPRYGFLSDFRSEESGDTRDVDSMNKFHLNVIQFYDWMYRHDELVPKEDEFIDPMGRTMSYKVVCEKVAAVHDKGMAAKFTLPSLNIWSWL